MSLSVKPCGASSSIAALPSDVLIALFEGVVAPDLRGPCVTVSHSLRACFHRHQRRSMWHHPSLTRNPESGGASFVSRVCVCVRVGGEVREPAPPAPPASLFPSLFSLFSSVFPSLSSLSPPSLSSLSLLSLLSSFQGSQIIWFPMPSVGAKRQFRQQLCRNDVLMHGVGTPMWFSCYTN